MTKRIIQITDGICKMPRWRLREPVNFTLESHENMAIVGDNGSGKSLLVDMLTGRHPLYPDMASYDFSPSDKELVSDNIKYIAFKDSYGGDNDRTFFLQQRWNQMEIDKETPTVGDKLEEAFLMAGEDTPARRQTQEFIYDFFHLTPLLDKYIILLSSGELRKFKLAATLFSCPKVLIMDNPFIGLDAQTREQLTELLASITQQDTKDNKLPHLNCQLILVLSKSNEIPGFINSVVEVKDLRVLPKVSREHYLYNRESLPSHVLSPQTEQEILRLPYSPDPYKCHEVVNMKEVSIRYGNRTILSNLNWKVKNGERWALSGQNGAGKSTLLSLICADNPQSYACDISLFEHQRGSGESIWEIKKHIGYVSPEMHRSYQRNIPAIRVVASGLKDSVGLYVKPLKEDYDICRFWMRVFGLVGKEETSLMELSSGEQRLVLLARAFVKDPELLILDEPLHGLDNRNRQLVKEVIEVFCKRKNKTLIMVTHYQDEFPPCITNHLWLKRHI